VTVVFCGKLVHDLRETAPAFTFVDNFIISFIFSAIFHAEN
jgi:hypothetical protein